MKYLITVDKLQDYLDKKDSLESPWVVYVREDNSVHYSLSISKRSYNMEFVDLGLSVYWATCNLIASSPEEVGAKYYWGSLTNNKYDAFSYNYKNTPYSDNTSRYKYSLDAFNKANVIDSNGNLKKEYDVAYKLLGEGYRIPTKADWLELMDNVNLLTMKLNNVDVLKITSKINGNSIYICVTNDSTNYSYIWTSTFNSSNENDAYACAVFSGYGLTFITDLIGSALYNHYPIRPVKVK